MNLNNKELFVNSLVFTVSLAIFLIIFELALRALVNPTENAYGVLFGQRLPPLDIVPWSRVRSTEEVLAQRKQWADRLVVDGKRIYFDDLGSIMREDPEIGYVPEENLTSSNNWYLTNSLGARARKDFTREVPTGKKRVLLFGDSFTAGFHLPQDETWAHYLDTRSENLEVVNFGVSGYGMGQAYMRYRQVKDRLQSHYVFLMIVPTSDLFRDINTIRSMGNKHWDSHKTNARFILEKGKLKLIPSPYKTINEMISENQNGLSDTLATHLENYESYYYPPVYQNNNSLIEGSMFYKLLLLGLNDNHKNSLKRVLMKPGSEAMRINRQIFSEMSQEINSAGAKLVVIVLPRRPDIRKYNSRPGFHRQWNKMVDYFRSDEFLMWNLMDEFQYVDSKYLDGAYDNSHYGPKAGRRIAEFIWKRTNGLGM
jgi:hypothetical protein